MVDIFPVFLPALKVSAVLSYVLKTTCPRLLSNPPEPWLQSCTLLPCGCPTEHAVHKVPVLGSHHLALPTVSVTGSY